MKTRLLLALLGLTVATTFPAQAPAASQDKPAGQSMVLQTHYGTSFETLVAGPEQADMAVLLVPGRWGMNGQCQFWLSTLSAQGIRVMAVDLFDGRPVRDAALAEEVWQAIDPVWIEADLAAALLELKQRSRAVMIMSWDNSVPFAWQLTQKNLDSVQGIITVGRPLRVVGGSYPVLNLSQANGEAKSAVRDFLRRWQ